MKRVWLLGWTAMTGLACTASPHWVPENERDESDGGVTPLTPEERATRCEGVHPACTGADAAFGTHPFEASLRAASCGAPVDYTTGEPHDYPYLRAALCPASPAIHTLGERRDVVVTSAACDACLPVAPEGLVYVIYRRLDVTGPNCPNNCVDMPWTESEW